MTKQISNGMNRKNKNDKVYKTPDFKGKNTVLFFSEGLMCYPACWDQIASFGEDERFNTDQIQAISILADSAEDWQKAIAEMPKLAKARTLFDENAATSRRLGMLTTASSMHRGMLPGHTYVLLNKDGIVNYIFDDPNMAMENEIKNMGYEEEEGKINNEIGSSQQEQKDGKYILPASIIFAGVIIAGAMIYGAAERPLQTQDLQAQSEEAVLPSDGIVLPVAWGDLGSKLVSVGAIDSDKFIKMYEEREIFTK